MFNKMKKLQEEVNILKDIFIIDFTTLIDKQLSKIQKDPADIKKEDLQKIKIVKTMFRELAPYKYREYESKIREIERYMASIGM